MHVIVILNSGAGSLNGGRDAPKVEELEAAFAAEGVVVGVRRASSDEVCAAFNAAAEKKPDAIIVGGGDGTIGTAAGCLAGTGIALGVLPLGTLNHFARDLGLPADWRGAVQVLAHSERRAVDVGEVNGRVFVNNCSIGSYPDAVRKREALRRSHGHGKGWAMFLATIAVLGRLRRLRVRIEMGGRTLAVRSPFVVVANNRYSARALAYSLRPRLDAGRLWIYTTRARRPLTILRQMWQSLRRAIDDVDGLDSFEVTEAVITGESGARMSVAIDGELASLEPPLRVRIRPGALLVLAPREKVSA